MKKYSVIFPILLLWTLTLWGQTIDQKDSLEIVNKVNILFDLFENPDFTDFEKISTQKIYCIICFHLPVSDEEWSILDRKEFFDNHLNKIKRSDKFIRATKSKEIMFIRENNVGADISIFFTIYQQDELAPGHEGGQFGISFKKVNGEFKFAGMETVP